MSPVTNMDERPGARPSKEDGRARVPGRPKVDVPPDRAAVGDDPRNVEDASRDMSQPSSIEQDPISQDQNQHIQQEDVDISQLYAKGNAEFGFANLQTGGDECESDNRIIQQ